MWRRVDLGFFYPEDGGDMFLRNIGSYKIHTGPRPRRRHVENMYLIYRCEYISAKIEDESPSRGQGYNPDLRNTKQQY
jgi:hypothetical protein